MNANALNRIWIAILVILLVPALAGATVRLVRQDGSGDFLTIAAALAAAGAGDTIDIGPGTYPESLDVTKRIAFIGSSGAAVTILDGQRTHRLMLLRSASSGSSITGLTLTRGAAEFGAGIYVESNCAVTIRNCAFTDVEFETCSDGAAIFASGPSTLAIEDCAFHDNYSESGSTVQIANGCILDVTRCDFHMNWSGFGAGCIAAHYSTLRVSESLFYTNASEELAAGIYFYRSNGSVARSTFFNNASSGGQAATIHVKWSAGVTIERNIFCRDKSGYALWDDYSFCTHICNVYWNNTAGNVGGSTSMDPTEFAADPLFCDPVFFDLAIAFESPAAGGNNDCGVLIGALDPACNYVPPEQCVPVRLKVRQDGSGDFTTIGAAYDAASNCDTIDVGPGTYPELLAVKKGVAFIGSSGPGITIVDGENARQCFVFTLGSTGASISGFTLTRAFFASNGAAIRVQDGVNVAVRNCRFVDNVSTANGAGFFVRHAGSRLTVEDCVFSGNNSVQGGTGTIIEPGTLDLARCVFHDNTTDVQGACISVDHATANIAECVMYDNTCLDVSGGIYFYYAVGFVRNCTFVGNTSSGLKAATIFLNRSPGVLIEKNIIASEQDGYGLWDYYDFGSSLNHTCNLFWDNELGDLHEIEPDPTELFIDPLFCNAVAADYTISYGSPAAPANNNCSMLIGACEPACHQEIATLLRSFSAERRENAIELRWELSAGSDEQAFLLKRSVDGGPFETVAAAIIARTGAVSYACTDDETEPGKSYSYQVAYLLEGRSIVLFETRAIAVPALPLALHQNYPNPFNPTTTIGYYLPEPAAVIVAIYDVAGSRLATLVESRQEAGPHAVEWRGVDGSGNRVSSGVYFYRLKAGSTVLTKKMILMQ